MTQCFIFSLNEGTYESAWMVVAAKTVEEAIQRVNKLDQYSPFTGDFRLNGYNFDYKENADIVTLLRYSSNLWEEVNKHHFKDEEILALDIAKKPYEELLNSIIRCHDYYTCISGHKYIPCGIEWWDYMPAMIPVPEDYFFSDGHSG